MKKCILSAMAGAAAMFFIILTLAYIHNSRRPAEYEHVDFVSTIDQEDCFLCGTHGGPQAAAHWGEDNVAILDLNTFKLHRLSTAMGMTANPSRQKPDMCKPALWKRKTVG